jgi:hypothetical protein
VDKSTDRQTETVKITGEYFRRRQEKDMLEEVVKLRTYERMKGETEERKN